MVLQPCRECAGQVSTHAATCPHCGAPRPAGHPPPRRNGIGSWKLLIGGVVLIIVGRILIGLDGYLESTSSNADSLFVEGTGTAAVVIRRDGVEVHSGEHRTEECGSRILRSLPPGNVEYTTRGGGHFITAQRWIQDADRKPIPEKWTLADYYDASTDGDEFYNSENVKAPLKIVASEDLRTVRLAGTVGLFLDEGTYDLDVTFRCD